MARTSKPHGETAGTDPPLNPKKRKNRIHVLASEEVEANFVPISEEEVEAREFERALPYVQEVPQPEVSDSLDFQIDMFHRTSLALMRILFSFTDNIGLGFATTKFQSLASQLRDMGKNIEYATEEHAQRLEQTLGVLTEVSQIPDLYSRCDQQILKTVENQPDLEIQLGRKKYPYKQGFHKLAFRFVTSVLQFAIEEIRNKDKEGRPTAPQYLNDGKPLLAAAEAKEVGAMFERAREDKELSQRAAARNSGIAPKNLRQIENGDTDPSLKTMRKIADGMGYDVEVRLVPKGNE
ncbi:helix-turn-helix transcriptional regulator [Phaeobacter sp. JH20_10]|uniref:helix-turn-helix domain-containing protein n=1 Tax=Phaeobacter sp. JH20_10 TaxID=3112469 RepID=UPI003A894F96